MSRIIDADRLYDQVEARYRQSSGEEHRTERSLLDAICDSPTINAIPVEWLREFDLYYAGISGGTKYMNELVEAWQKGQEAR